MKVMMLGWEYPPMISGGLATASEGLTLALSAQGVDIDFVLPRVCGKEDSSHMSILACEELREAAAPTRPKTLTAEEGRSIVDTLFSAYARPRQTLTTSGPGTVRAELPPGWLEREPVQLMHDLFGGDHHHDPLLREVARYTRAVAATSERRKFDVVHAHDWMTFPAGILLAHRAQVPLVIHVHSLEYDRCGEGGNILIKGIEAAGVHHADQIIAVSEYTRGIISARLGVAPGKISVAHNGVKQATDEPRPRARVSVQGEGGPLLRKPRYRPRRPKKRVLFLGRVTYQKGPDTFVEAAAQVLTKMRDVVFVLAGSGDMLPRMKARVRELGIESSFEFPGFVTGRRLEEEFSKADLYVMPSISEPFGIAPLEALSYGTPAIISKQSGVSEVLSHVLKTDFWDVRKIADFILNAVQSPELGRSMMAMSRSEVRRLRWERAADSVILIYQKVLSDMSSVEVG